MQRTVAAQGQLLCYELTHKRVKNLNLRLGPSGDVRVSAPKWVALEQIDAFVISRSGWISAARRRQQLYPAIDPSDCPYTDLDCDAALLPWVRRWVPFFQHQLQGELPKLRYQAMKSRWGVCYPQRKLITLNRWLVGLPAFAQEYVVLHELVHLDHADHQADFYAELSSFMPNWKERQAFLRRLRPGQTCAKTDETID